MIMEPVTTERIYLEVPRNELPFIRSLSKKMGWTIKKTRKSGIQQALDDVEAGHVYEAKSIDDLMAQLDA
jgi:hypothetical protein